jgi:cytochrome b6-f complex iron-sulfur subunit
MKENPERVQVSRRGFVNIFIGFFGGLFAFLSLYPIFSYLWPYKGTSSGTGELSLPLQDVPLNGYKVVNYKEDKVILIRLENRVIALSAICPHLGCLVKYRKEGFIQCPCHDGRFDFSGNVIAGPPPRPLVSYPVRIAQKKIVLGG